MQVFRRFPENLFREAKASRFQSPFDFRHSFGCRGVASLEIGELDQLISRHYFCSGGSETHEAIIRLKLNDLTGNI
jgi:hypothetical protein